MSLIIESILKKGVAKGHSQILSKTEINELENLIKKLYEDKSKEIKTFNNIIGLDKKLDKLLEKILTNSEIQSNLLKLLGENYLLRHASARFNDPNDKGLSMHQDSLGEVSLTFLVNDQNEGSTFFIPGSQLIPSNKNLAPKVSWNSLKVLNLINFFIFKAKGEAGSYYYFINRTWHGRLPGKTDKKNLSLFFSFFPVSAIRNDLITKDLEYNSKFNLDKITEPNLKKFLSRENYKKAVENYNNSKNFIALSMQVNSYNIIIKNLFYFIFVILKLFFLELVFFPIKLKRFLKL